jgi:hypothetical protein
MLMAKTERSDEFKLFENGLSKHKRNDLHSTRKMAEGCSLESAYQTNPTDLDQIDLDGATFSLKQRNPPRYPHVYKYRRFYWDRLHNKSKRQPSQIYMKSFVLFFTLIVMFIGLVAIFDPSLESPQNSLDQSTDLMGPPTKFKPIIRLLEPFDAANLDFDRIPLSLRNKLTNQSDMSIFNHETYVELCSFFKEFCDSIREPIKLEFSLNSNVITSFEFNVTSPLSIDQITIQLITTDPQATSMSMCQFHFHALSHRQMMQNVIFATRSDTIKRQLHAPFLLASGLIKPISNQTLSLPVSPLKQLTPFFVTMNVTCLDLNANQIFGLISIHQN